MFDHGQQIDIPHRKIQTLNVREVTLVMEAIKIKGGKTTMRIHHFDPRELPVVALNRGRIFFLAKPLVVDGRNSLSTDLERIM